MNYSELKTQAELALAAYAVVTPGGITASALTDQGFVSPRADFIANEYVVAATFSDITGVSATVFKERATGRVFLSVRGTEFTNPNDLLTDGILATVGVALLNPQYLSLQKVVDAWVKDGVLPSIESGGFTVTGHSLGGYLAGALKNQFSSITAAYLFNAPGNGGMLGSAAGLIFSEISTDPPGTTGIWNVKGSEGLSLIAGLGAPQSTVIPVQIEAASGFGLGNHSMFRLIDSLCVQAKYLEAFPSLTPSELNAIVDACGVREASLEPAVDVLTQAVLGVSTPITIGDRDALYERLDALTADALGRFRASEASVVTLVNKTAAQLVALATGTTAQAVAVRQALTQLAPIAIISPSAEDSNSWSAEYLQARAAMLERKFWFNQQELSAKLFSAPTTPEDWQPLYAFQVEDTNFRDLSSGYEIAQGGPYSSTKRYAFASPQGDTLNGGGAADLLFGNSGIDVIVGGDGADLLEGYGGNDVLDGGGGADTLRGGTGDDWLGYTAAAVTAASADELSDSGNVYAGGEGSDHMAGSGESDTYVYVRGDGHDTIWEQLDTEAAKDEAIFTGISLSEVGFTRIGSDLKIFLPADGSVTIKSWFAPTGTRRVESLSFSDQRLDAGVVTQRVNQPDTTQFKLIYQGTDWCKYAIEHQDGSSIIKTVHSTGRFELAYLASPPTEERPPKFVETLTRYYNADGSFLKEREDFADGSTYEFYTAEGFASIRVGFPHKDLIAVVYKENEGELPRYEITTEAKVPGSWTSTAGGGTTAPQLHTPESLLSLPLVLPSGITQASVIFARNTQGSFLVGSSNVSTENDTNPLYWDSHYLVLPATYTPTLAFAAEGSPLSAAQLAAAPLLLTTGLGAILSDEVPSGGILLDRTLSTVVPKAYRTVTGEVWLEWNENSLNSTSLSFPPDAAPVIRKPDGTELGKSLWEDVATKVFATGDLVEVAVLAAGTELVLARELDFNSPDTSIVQRVNDLCLLFSDGTQLVFKDWALRPAALALTDGNGATWAAATVASRVQGYVGDDNDNTYTVLTPRGQWVYGGEGNDILWGGATPGEDLLDGQDGADRLYGRGGDDLLVGGPGIDFLDGGDGQDTLYGSEQADQLWGQAGNDNLFAGEGDDRVYGNDGDDLAEGGQGNDVVAGGAGNDTLHGAEGDDDLFGGAGSDVLYGENGVNRLYGEAGDDRLYGGAEKNVLSGGAGNDELHASGIYDELYGGGGVDHYLLSAHAGANRFLFEDVEGGTIDLSDYMDSGIAVQVQRASADQLIITMSNQEMLVINGWSHGTCTLTAGAQSWSSGELANRPNTFQLFGGPPQT